MGGVNNGCHSSAFQTLVYRNMQAPWGSHQNAGSNSVGLRWYLRIQIFYKLPDDIDASGSQITF